MVSLPSLRPRTPARRPPPSRAPLSMFSFRWQFFLVSAPILRSFSSMRMHISAMSCTCRSSRSSMLTSGIAAQPPCRPGNLGAWVPKSEDAPTASPAPAPGRAYSPPRYPRARDLEPPATSPHGWVRLRDAIRKRSVRPSARRARAPARLPAPHRLSPPYLRHEPSTVGCAAGRVSFRLRPKVRAPPPARAPAPEAARPIARAGARARHIPAGQWCAGSRPTSRSRGGATPDLQASPPTVLGCGTFPRPPRGCSRCLRYTAEVTLLDCGTA